MVLVGYIHTRFNRWFFTLWQQISLFSRTLLNILADFNNAVIFMVLILPSNFQFRQFLFPAFRDRSPKKNLYNCFYSYFILLSFFSSPIGSRYLLILSLPLTFTWWSTDTAKSTRWHLLFLFFFLLTLLLAEKRQKFSSVLNRINARSCLLVGIWWSVYIWEYQRIHS